MRWKKTHGSFSKVVTAAAQWCEGTEWKGMLALFNLCLDPRHCFVFDFWNFWYLLGWNRRERIHFEFQSNGHINNQKPIHLEKQPMHCCLVYFTSFIVLPVYTFFVNIDLLLLYYFSYNFLATNISLYILTVTVDSTNCIISRSFFMSFKNKLSSLLFLNKEDFASSNSHIIWLNGLYWNFY